MSQIRDLNEIYLNQSESNKININLNRNYPNFNGKSNGELLDDENNNDSNKSVALEQVRFEEREEEENEANLEKGSKLKKSEW